VPKTRRREELAVIVGLEVLAEGVAFDSHDLRKLPFRPAHVTRVLRALVNAGVLTRASPGKYFFTDEFQALMKGEILAKLPRSGILQFPPMAVFDICGLETWSERELDQFVGRLKEHWLDVTLGQQQSMLKA
jgi:hypothetical protein